MQQTNISSANKHTDEKTSFPKTCVVDPDQDLDPHGSTFILVGSIQIRMGLWIRIQEGQNDPQVKKIQVSTC